MIKHQEHDPGQAATSKPTGNTVVLDRFGPWDGGRVTEKFGAESAAVDTMSGTASDASSTLPTDYQQCHDRYGPEVIGEVGTERRERVDQAGVRIVAAVLNGEVTPEAGGWVLYEWVLAGGVVDCTVRSMTHNVSRNVRSHLIERAINVVLRKLTDQLVTHGGNGFDFHLSSGSSFVGWAVKLIDSVVRFEVNRELAADRRCQLVDFTAPDTEHLVQVNSEIDVGSQVWLGDKAVHVDTLHVWREILGLAQTATTGHHRQLIGLRIWSLVYGVPSLARPLHWEDRDAISKRARSHFTTIVTSLELHLTRKQQELRGFSSDLAGNDLLDQLWEPLDADQTDTLLNLPGDWLRQFVVASCMTRMRPSAEEIGAFGTSVGRSGATQGWMQVANPLATAFVATEFEAVSGYNRRATDVVKGASEAMACTQRGDFKHLAEAAAAFPGSPLGSTVHEVTVRLLELAVKANLMISQDYLDVGPVEQAGNMIRNAEHPGGKPRQQESTGTTSADPRRERKWSVHQQPDQGAYI